MAVRRAGSGRLDRNSAHRLLHLDGLRDANGQHALLIFGLDILIVHLERQTHGSREGAVAELHVVGPAVPLLVLGLLLTLNREEIAGERDVEILLIETGDLGSDDELLVVIGDVDGWAHAQAGTVAKAAEPVEELVEDAVDLTAQRE